MNVTFVTGNQNKAYYLSRYLGFAVDHVKLDLEEVQSLDLKTVVEHKVRGAYDQIKKPVLVEDQTLSFIELGRLPGTFSKFFEQELGFEKYCRLLDNFNSRSARAVCGMGYYVGDTFVYFEKTREGSIADHPRGSNGYGWDAVFIPTGYKITRAEMNEEDDRKTYLQIKPFAEVKEFLESLDKA